MYNFKSETEEKRFNITLNKCIDAFKKQKSARKLKKAVDCNLNLLRVAKLNYRQGTEFYTYEIYLVQKYLDCLLESGLYVFSEDEKTVFNSFLREIN